MGKKSLKKSGKKLVKRVKKTVEVEVDESIEDTTEIDEAIEYCNEMKPVYKNFTFNILKDKQGYDKLEIQSRVNPRVPFMMRFSRYRLLVKSFFPNSKVDAAKEEEILGFNFDRRDCGMATTNCTIWYKSVFRPDKLPDVSSFKMWLDYMCDPTKPKPKLSISKSNHFV